MSEQRDKRAAFFTSPILKKVWTGITGLGLVLFVIVHMLGNLSYFAGMDAYNLYSEKITSGFGIGTPIYYAIEVGLLLFVVVHVIIGINIFWKKRQARSTGYTTYQSVGEPSRQTFSSRTMIITGIVLLVFLVIHLASFRFGPGIAEGYVTTIKGEQMRDIGRLLREKFQHPLYAFGYPAVMILLGFHLRHGIWSAFQSLGAMNSKWTPVVYAIGTVLAILIAVGFLVLPLWIYFGA